MEYISSGVNFGLICCIRRATAAALGAAAEVLNGINKHQAKQEK